MDQGSLFVAGWRPFIGWVCGLSLALAFVVMPVAGVMIALTGSKVTVPSIDTTQTMGLLMGMLGLSGLRSFDKAKGVETNKIT